jgi:PKD repeat protein
MRPSWLSLYQLGRRPSRRKRRSDARLRVRQLERRRVLDASIQSLIVSPVIAEGQTATATATATGTGPLTFDWTLSENGNEIASGSQTSVNPSEPVEFNFVLPDDTEQSEQQYQLRLTVTDSDETSDSAMIDLEASNVRPVLVVASDQSTNEGALLDLSGVAAPPLGLFIDDGLHDTHTATVDWGDGSPVESPTIFFANGSGALGGSHTYAENGIYAVTVSVADDDGDSDTQSFQVTVNNVRPVLVVASDQSIDEGAQLDLSGDGAPPLGLYIDDGVPDTHTATIDWGDGSAPENATVFANIGSGALGGTHVYADNGVYTVTVTILDDDGGSDTQSFTVTVGNVAPTATLANDGPVNEGSTAQVTFSNAQDPGTVDSNAAFRYAYDFDNDGTFDVGDGTYAGSITNDSQTVPAALLDDGPATHIVRARILDKDDGFTDYATPLIVRNVAPTLVVADDQIVNEGALLDLSGVGAPPLGLFIDPGIVDTHTATIDWGDGSAVESAAVFFASGSGALGGTHTYADDGTYTATVTIMDDDGGSATKQFTVTVNNVRPVLVVANDQTVAEGSLLDLSGVGAPPLGLFIDDGILDTHLATIDWGDGTAAQNAVVFFANGSGALGGTHIYADDGLYTVTVAVTDDDGGSDTKTFQVTVTNADPTLTLPNGNQIVSEGQSLSFANLASFTDPGFDNPLNPTTPSTGDPLAESFTFDIDWGDGRDAVIGMSVADINGSPGVPSSGTIPGAHTYADDGVYTVTVTVHDDNGGSDTQTFTVTVNNVNPTLVLTHGNQTIFEGQAVSFTDLATFTDPGFDNPLNPTVPGTGNPLAESFTYDIDWGDGRDAIVGMNVADINGSPGVPSSGTIPGSHTYADDGVYTVTVTVHDDNGGSHAQVFTVTVQNLAPSVINTTSLTVNEGSAFTLIGLNVVMTDPGFDNPLNPIPGGELQETIAIHSINWGDGTAPDRSSVSIVNRVAGQPGTPTTAQFSHAPYTYADDGDYTVTVRVADDDMGAFADTGRFTSGVAGVDFIDLVFTIRVNNVAPTLTAITPTVTTISESEGVSFTGDFTDPGFDNPLNPNAAVPPLIADPLRESFTYDIDWGDSRQTLSAVAVPDTNGSAGTPSKGTFGGSHVYADDGLYTVTITIRDDNAGVHTRVFQVTVQNVDPKFMPVPGGASFAGDDVTAEGITRIRVAFEDQGFDNPANPNAPAPPAITDTRHESFTHVIHWGDGTVDAVHTYVDSGTYAVSVTVTGPGGTQTFSFSGFNSALEPVLTLVASQPINDPAIPAQLYTFVVDWGDGAAQTIPLLLKQPGVPSFNNGLTTVLASVRTSGGEIVPTTGSFEIEHRYVGPPNPNNPTANIRIDVAVVDDNNGSVSDFITVRNPGIQVVNVAIDTTPDVPRLELAPPPVVQVFIDPASSFAQGLQQTTARVARSELTATTDRYLELQVIAADGKTVLSRHRIPDEVLSDLRAFFATLPDNHYRIYLVRTENNSYRLIMDVYVRGGRVVDPTDDSEGTRDRPPTSETPVQTAPPPPDENPFLDQPPATPENVPTAPAADGVSEPQGRSEDVPADATTGHALEVNVVEPTDATARLPVLVPLRASSRWMVPLVGLGLATGRSWSQEVRTALEQADERDWQRLRRAGRIQRCPKQ